MNVHMSSITKVLTFHSRALDPLFLLLEVIIPEQKDW
jgi:hypothetical protein